jgi:UDPglucose 6-dehydrogenase
VSRIFIVGAGQVGLATGRALLGAGHGVTYIDTDPERVADLCLRGVDARPELKLAGEGEAFIVLTLPTPAAVGRPGAGYDLGPLREGVRAVGRALAGADSRHIVVLRSTVPPGTTDGMVRHLLERVSGKRAGIGFDLACLPEFLRPGHDDHDTQWPVLTVVGTQDPRLADRITRELAPFGGVQQRVSSAAAAEMIKCVYVARRAVDAAFWGEISAVCEHFELDVAQIGAALDEHEHLAAWNSGDHDHRPKDTGGFLTLAADAGIGVPVLTAAAEAGRSHQLPGRIVPRRREVARAELAGSGAGLIMLDRPAAAVPNGRP